VFFNRQERKSDLEIAENRNQENALQNYLDKMNELILSGFSVHHAPVFAALNPQEILVGINRI
jgi:hypothetical protein